MPYQISTKPVVQTDFVKLGTAEARLSFRRKLDCHKEVQEITLHENYANGAASIDTKFIIPCDYDPVQGINLTEIFVDIFYDLHDFKFGYFTYLCSIEDFESLKATTEITYKLDGIKGLEGAGWRFEGKDIFFFGQLQIKAV